jgi:hypothetical protein
MDIVKYRERILWFKKEIRQCHDMDLQLHYMRRIIRLCNLYKEYNSNRYPREIMGIIEHELFL